MARPLHWRSGSGSRPRGVTPYLSGKIGISGSLAGVSQRKRTAQQMDFAILSRRIDKLGLEGDYAAKVRTAIENARERVLEKE